MDGAAVLEVTHQGDAQAIKTALFLDGVQVQQGLGGMMAGSVTGIDHRHGRELGGQAGRALLGVADDQGVGVTGHHPHCIRQGLALGDGGALRRAQVDHAATKPLHGRLKGHAGSGRGLEEQKCQDLARHHIALFAPGIGLQGCGQIQDRVDLLPGELSHGENMPLHEHALQIGFLG